MEKNKLSVTINGRMYTLISEETREYMRSLADYVNSSVEKIKNNNPALMSEKPLVLAALNICDELFKAQIGAEAIIQKTKKSYDEIAEENKQLREVINNSDYEIEITTLQHQLEQAKEEIERLRKRLGY